jgi:hypothetical protein
MSPAPVRPNEPIARAAPRATFGTRGPLRRGERSMRQQPLYTILAGVSREHSVGGGLPRFERIDAVPLRNTRGMGHEAGKAARAEPLHPRYRLNPRGSGISMIRQHGAAQPQNHGTIGEGTDSLKPRGAARIRTGDKGFAVLCLTTWPRRQIRNGGGQLHAAAPIARAGDRTRTGDLHVGNVLLYQLSYSRIVMRQRS